MARSGDHEPLADLRLDAPAFHRNCGPIGAVLARWLKGKQGNVLEVGSGSGQHVIEFAKQSPQLLWWPTDRDERNLRSIDAWRQYAHAQWDPLESTCRHASLSIL